jgi:hypothetical protein
MARVERQNPKGANTAPWGFISYLPLAKLPPDNKMPVIGEKAGFSDQTR